MNDDERKNVENSVEEAPGVTVEEEEIPFEETAKDSEIIEEDEVPFEETVEKTPGITERSEKIPFEETDKSPEIIEKEKNTADESSEGNSKGLEGKNQRIHRTAIRAVAAIAVIAAACLVCIYIRGVNIYETAYFPNTYINGYNVSGRTVGEAENMMEDFLREYSLTLIERGGETEVITGDDVGLHLEFGGVPEALIENQNPYAWPRYLFVSSEFTIDAEIACYREMCSESIEKLDLMDESLWQDPEDARISDYEPEIRGYEVIPAWPGTEILPDNVWLAVVEAVLTLKDEVDLEAEGCYLRPAETETDPVLADAVTRLNNYTNTVINYTFGDDIETLNGDRIHEWLTLEEDFTVTLDEDKVKEFVSELAEAHNTAGKDKNFETSYGYTITISNPNGTYGWMIDEGSELETLLDELPEGITETREPEYSRRAAGYGDEEYGDTYVEINLEAQHLWFYKNGELVVESDIVSGNSSRNMETPDGAYYVYSRERNRTLRGEDYQTPVNYWMPFIGGIGLHDATWRASFGGTIYMTNGSHGCVNLPLSVAQTIYENIAVGDPVMCYYLDPSTIPADETEEETAQNKEMETDSSATEDTSSGSSGAVTPNAPASGTTAAPEPQASAAAALEPETEAAVPDTAQDQTEGVPDSAEELKSATSQSASPDTESLNEEFAPAQGPALDVIRQETSQTPEEGDQGTGPGFSGSGGLELIGPGYQ